MKTTGIGLAVGAIGWGMGLAGTVVSGLSGGTLGAVGVVLSGLGMF